MTGLLTNLANAQRMPDSPLGFDEASQQLQTIAETNPDWSLYAAEGDSMLPHYGDNTLLMVKNASLNDLKPGMIAVYQTSDNELVGHSVMSVSSREATVRGSNNSRIDPEIINDNNLVGIVMGSFHTKESTNGDLPVVLGKRY